MHTRPLSHHMKHFPLLKTHMKLQPFLHNITLRSSYLCIWTLGLSLQNMISLSLTQQCTNTKPFPLSSLTTMILSPTLLIWYPGFCSLLPPIDVSTLSYIHNVQVYLSLALPFFWYVWLGLFHCIQHENGNLIISPYWEWILSPLAQSD